MNDHFNSILKRKQITAASWNPNFVKPLSYSSGQLLLLAYYTASDTQGWCTLWKRLTPKELKDSCKCLFNWYENRSVVSKILSVQIQPISKQIILNALKRKKIILNKSSIQFFSCKPVSVALQKTEDCPFNLHGKIYEINAKLNKTLQQNWAKTLQMWCGYNFQN